jgi:MFS transporter, FHS family, Na+ dependent glucose transporter 1
MTSTASTLSTGQLARRRQTTISAAYYAAFIGLGLVTASLGPTLSGLAEHTGSALSTISWLFTMRALGYLLGSFLGGRLYDRLPGHPIVAAMFGLIIVTMVLTPMISIFWLLAFVILLLGVGEGTMDVGVNTLIVWLHRPNVGPAMNALHFFFGVGTVISPLIVAQAIGLSGDITWAYWVLALLLLPIVFWLARLPSPTPEEDEGTTGDTVTNYLLTGMVAFFLFLYVGMEGSFSGWIDKYALALGHATELTAAYWTSLFWFAFTFGRLLSIPVTARVRPRTLLAGGLIGGIVCVGAILIWPGSATVLSVGVFGAGVCMASIFPVTLTWAGRRMTITGFVTSWFFIGASAGGMFFPWLIGQLFESTGPRVTMFTILGSLLLGLAWFGILTFYAGNLKTQNAERRA